MDEIKIFNLYDKQEYIEIVSTWIWQEFEHVELENIIYRTQHSICNSDIPQMFIALKGNVPIAVVSLWRTELKSRQDLYPWLATLYVMEKYRGNGVAKKMQQHVLQVAKQLGYQKIYLTTTLENYYEKSGWHFLEYAPKENGNITKIYYYIVNEEG